MRSDETTSAIGPSPRPFGLADDVSDGLPDREAQPEVRLADRNADDGKVRPHFLQEREEDLQSVLFRVRGRVLFEPGSGREQRFEKGAVHRDVAERRPPRGGRRERGGRAVTAVVRAEKDRAPGPGHGRDAFRGDVSRVHVPRVRQEQRPPVAGGLRSRWRGLTEPPLDLAPEPCRVCLVKEAGDRGGPDGRLQFTRTVAVRTLLPAAAEIVAVPLPTA